MTREDRTREQAAVGQRGRGCRDSGVAAARHRPYEPYGGVTITDETGQAVRVVGYGTPYAFTAGTGSLPDHKVEDCPCTKLPCGHRAGLVPGRHCSTRGSEHDHRLGQPLPRGSLLCRTHPQASQRRRSSKAANPMPPHQCQIDGTLNNPSWRHPLLVIQMAGSSCWPVYHGRPGQAGGASGPIVWALKSIYCHDDARRSRPMKHRGRSR